MTSCPPHKQMNRENVNHPKCKLAPGLNLCPCSSSNYEWIVHRWLRVNEKIYAGHTKLQYSIGSVKGSEALQSQQFMMIETKCLQPQVMSLSRYHLVALLYVIKEHCRTQGLPVDKLRENKTNLEYLTLVYHILLQQSEWNIAAGFKNKSKTTQPPSSNQRAMSDHLISFKYTDKHYTT